MIARPKTYKVSILNEMYSFVCDDSEEHLTHVASLVDSLMKEIAKSASLVDEKRIAVLAALRLGSQLVHLESELTKKHQDENQRLIDLIDRQLSSL